jgi:hypothetical protein
MFADETRFGRMNRPRPCRATRGTRPDVPSQLILEYIHLYKSIDAVYAKLNEATGYINRNPQLVKSITSFPYIVWSF